MALPSSSGVRDSSKTSNCQILCPYPQGGTESPEKMWKTCCEMLGFVMS